MAAQRSEHLLTAGSGGMAGRQRRGTRSERGGVGNAALASGGQPCRKHRANAEGYLGVGSKGNCSLEQALRERVVFPFVHDDVVFDFDSEEPSGLPDSRRRFHILVAWEDIGTRMIVTNDDGNRALQDC